MIGEYFAGLRVGLYRQTRDGRFVMGRRSPFRRKWFLVRPEDRDTIETRALRAQVGLPVLIGVTTPLFFVIGVPATVGVVAAVSLVAAAAVSAWMTSGLDEVALDETDLQPRDWRKEELAYARAIGRRSIYGYVAMGVLLTAIQGIGLIVDGEWWMWVGVLMFGAATGYFVRLLYRLRATDA